MSLQTLIISSFISYDKYLTRLNQLQMYSVQGVYYFLCTKYNFATVEVERYIPSVFIVSGNMLYVYINYF